MHTADKKRTVQSFTEEYIRKKKEGGDTYESFVRTVKCRKCSEAGRTISSVIKVMRYLVRNMERRRPLWKKRGGGK